MNILIKKNNSSFLPTMVLGANPYKSSYLHRKFGKLFYPPPQKKNGYSGTIVKHAIIKNICFKFPSSQ